jgi:hypothetical protein
VLGRAVVEREQLVEVIGDLRGGPRELRLIGGIEGLRRGPGVVLVLGEGLLRGRVGGFGQRRDGA